jgi:hypothetical protein
MTTEILLSLLNIALVLGGAGITIAVGLWILNGMTEDDDPIEHSSNGNLPKPPPEPGH